MGLILAALLALQDLPSRVLQPHGKSTDGALFTPEGKLLVTHGAPDRTVKVWIVDTGKQLYTLADAALAVAMTADGTRVAIAGSAVTTIWDPAGGNRLLTLESGPADAVAFSANGATLTTLGARKVTQWNTKAGTKLLSFEFPVKDLRARAVGAGGTRVALAYEDRTVHLWDVETQKEVLTLTVSEGKVTGAAFSPDGSRLATVGEDLTLRIWETSTGKELKRVAEGADPDSRLAFDAAGALLAVSSTAGVDVWDLKADRKVSTCRPPALGAFIPGALSFSADGRTLLAGGTMILKNAPKDAKTTGPLYFWKLKG